MNEPTQYELEVDNLVSVYTECMHNFEILVAAEDLAKNWDFVPVYSEEVGDKFFDNDFVKKYGESVVKEACEKYEGVSWSGIQEFLLADVKTMINAGSERKE